MYRLTVDSDTSMERAIQAPFQVWPWQWASIVQNLRIVVAGNRNPRLARSRSRNVEK